MKCLAQAVAEKSRGQDFQGQCHCGKVKGQSVTKRDISKTPHEDESVLTGFPHLQTEEIPYLFLTFSRLKLGFSIPIDMHFDVLMRIFPI
jgi:hypothetical protein